MELYEATKSVLRILPGSRVVWTDLREKPTVQQELESYAEQPLGDGRESERD